MKVTLENTDKIVTLIIDGTKVPARLWQGETSEGVPCFAFITRIAPAIETTDPRIHTMAREFERDLQRTAEPTAAVMGLPLHLFLD